MSNFIESTFLPPLQSAKRRIDGKKELIRVEKNDLIETLPHCMNDKLYIDESAKQNVVNKFVQDATTRKEITKHAHDWKKVIIPLYNIDGISSEELQAFLRGITENTQQPFSFLVNISKEFANDRQLPTKPTEIDIQLAAAAKRIESNRILLEETKSYAKDIYLRAKQDSIRSSSEMHNDISIFMKNNIKSGSNMEKQLTEGRANV